MSSGAIGWFACSTRKLLTVSRFLEGEKLALKVNSTLGRPDFDVLSCPREGPESRWEGCEGPGKAWPLTEIFSVNYGGRKGENI